MRRWISATSFPFFLLISVCKGSIVVLMIKSCCWLYFVTFNSFVLHRPELLSQFHAIIVHWYLYKHCCPAVDCFWGALLHKCCTRHLLKLREISFLLLFYAVFTGNIVVRNPQSSWFPEGEFWLIVCFRSINCSYFCGRNSLDTMARSRFSISRLPGFLSMYWWTVCVFFLTHQIDFWVWPKASVLLPDTIRPPRCYASHCWLSSKLLHMPTV
jgi:hypothetical protein